MDRVNKFIEIYKTCSNGTNEEKYLRIKNGELTLPRYVDVELICVILSAVFVQQARKVCKELRAICLKKW